MEIVRFGPERTVALTLITLDMLQNQVSNAKREQTTNRHSTIWRSKLNLVEHSNFVENTTDASDSALFIVVSTCDCTGLIFSHSSAKAEHDLSSLCM